eukprot:6589043-Pyramimonas_sp.AAC.1
MIQRGGKGQRGEVSVECRRRVWPRIPTRSEVKNTRASSRIRGQRGGRPRGTRAFNRENDKLRCRLLLFLDGYLDEVGDDGAGAIALVVEGARRGLREDPGAHGPRLLVADQHRGLHALAARKLQRL